MLEIKIHFSGRFSGVNTRIRSFVPFVRAISLLRSISQARKDTMLILCLINDITTIITHAKFRFNQIMLV